MRLQEFKAEGDTLQATMREFLRMPTCLPHPFPQALRVWIMSPGRNKDTVLLTLDLAIG